MSADRQFAELFKGRTDAWGTGRGGVIRTHRLPLSLYGSHLAGEGSGIGIFPMLDDNTCWFAAIDLDEPNFELARTLQSLIPGTSWIERSRSGNAHVWVFFERPCPAWAARAVLKFALEAVGRPEVEVFPKQDGLREGMLGNYINLPYHGQDVDGKWRRPIGHGGPIWWLPLDAFLAAAPAKRQNPDAWERRARQIGAKPPEEREATSEWGEAPILHQCAKYILDNRDTNPIRAGSRAQVLFHVAVQLLNWRDLTIEEARDLVLELNAAAKPPLDRREVLRQFDNAVNGRWTATGCDDPVMRDYVDPDCPIANGEVGR